MCGPMSKRTRFSRHRMSLLLGISKTSMRSLSRKPRILLSYSKMKSLRNRGAKAASLRRLFETRTRRLQYIIDTIMYLRRESLKSLLKKVSKENWKSVRGTTIMQTGSYAAKRLLEIN